MRKTIQLNSDTTSISEPLKSKVSKVTHKPDLASTIERSTTEGIAKKTKTQIGNALQDEERFVDLQLPTTMAVPSQVLHMSLASTLEHIRESPFNDNSDRNSPLLITALGPESHSALQKC